MPPRRASAHLPAVSVLRVGHRPGRDPRLTTHVALAARAFGAERMYLHPPDPALARRISEVADRWGGTFAIEGTDDWKGVVRAFDGLVVHLTMYGEPLAAKLPTIRRERHLLVVVGGAKVPSELYQRAGLNIAVGHQPHSEVAALAVFLAQVRGVPGPAPWPGAAQAVVPTARGKKVTPMAGAGEPA
jgi:tRNA (cytidine56-2'-O)-methyltransferase